MNSFADVRTKAFAIRTPDYFRNVLDQIIRALRDLVDDLEGAFEILVASERRARKPTTQTRYATAAGAVEDAARLLDELRMKGGVS